MLVIPSPSTNALLRQHFSLITSFGGCYKLMSVGVSVAFAGYSIALWNYQYSWHGVLSQCGRLGLLATLVRWGCSNRVANYFVYMPACPSSLNSHQYTDDTSISSPRGPSKWVTTHRATCQHHFHTGWSTVVNQLNISYMNMCSIRTKLEWYFSFF